MKKERVLKIVAGISLLGLIASCQQKKYPQGKRLYDFHCANCHMNDGSGVGNLYPAFQNSKYLGDRFDSLPCIIIRGKPSSVINTISMPGNQTLTSAELSNLINYMLATWGKRSQVTIKELKDIQARCPS